MRPYAQTSICRLTHLPGPLILTPILRRLIFPPRLLSQCPTSQHHYHLDWLFLSRSSWHTYLRHSWVRKWKREGGPAALPCSLISVGWAMKLRGRSVFWDRSLSVCWATAWHAWEGMKSWTWQSIRFRTIGSLSLRDAQTANLQSDDEFDLGRACAVVRESTVKSNHGSAYP